jgi:hypothetical protein
MDRTKERDCGEVVPSAERELAAFLGAVKAMFGAEQVGLAADEWLEQLMARNRLPCSAREWRTITASASQRLASRWLTLRPGASPGVLFALSSASSYTLASRV